MSPTDHRERRPTPRKRPLRLVYVELANANGGMMRDLSTEGFAVRAMLPVRAGEPTPFSFSLNDDVKVAGEGQILWVEEGGRVAGVQFTNVSDQAREQILDWMTQPDAPAKQESAGEKAEPTEPPTLEQLRLEMYSVPPRPEGTHPLEAPVIHEVSESVGEPHPETISGPAEAGFELREPPKPQEIPHRPVYHADAQTPEERFESPPAPALPRLTLTPKVVAPIFPHERPSPPPPPHEISSGKGHWKPSVLETPPADEVTPPEPEHSLPDISAILMQPAKAQAAQPQAHRGPVETLASWNAATAVEERWTERLSLSSAITVMMIIALLAGLYVFHRNVGQGLIWLGEALGGVPQAQIDQAQDTQSAVQQTPNHRPSTADSSTNPTSSPSPTEPDVSPGPPAALSSNNSGTERTATANAIPNSSSPATPLAGMTSPLNSEAGQVEYTQAMQILHGKNANVDTPEVLRLLWIAVEKGNSNAELELAEMYWHGRGVIQNCDQTLILLTAAARKGSAEAQKRLFQYRKEGCE